MASTVVPMDAPRTIPVTCSVTVANNEFVEIDPTDGQLDAIGAANTGRIGVALADGVATDEVSVAIEGIFLCLNSTGGTLEIGDTVYAKDGTSLDAGSTGDRPVGTIVGPLSSNADAANVHVQLAYPLAVK